MDRLLTLYFIFDDDFVIRKILWCHDDAVDYCNRKALSFVPVQVINDPAVIDSHLTFSVSVNR